jgi:hypothetical protein
MNERISANESKCDTSDPEQPGALQLAIENMRNRTPEQIMADRELILSSSRRARPLPPGKTLLDMVEGTWPGDETDQEIYEMLERLS